MTIDDKTKQWLDAHAADSGKKISESDAFISLYTKSLADDPLCALQIGFAVLMDKPICLIVDGSVRLPKQLVKVAGLIERVKLGDQNDMNRAMASIRGFIERGGGQR